MKKRTFLYVALILICAAWAPADEILWPGDNGPWPPESDGAPDSTWPDEAGEASESPWPGESENSTDPGTLTPSSAGSWDTGTFSLFGYISWMSGLEFPDWNPADTLTGSMMHLRLKGDWSPEASIDFHLEADYRAAFGRLNPQAQANNLLLQLGAATESELLNAQSAAGEDFHQEFGIDHAWGLVNIGPADLKFGLCPIAWGTGYAFNPTSRAYSAASVDLISDSETPGTAAVIPSLQISPRWSLHGYLAFQDRLRPAQTPQIESDPANLPFGIKLLGYAGSWDFSFGIIKEVSLYDADPGDPVEFTALRRYYAAWDFIGQIGDFGLYGEGLLQAPADGNSIDWKAGIELPEQLQAVIGIEYNEFENTTLTLEYFLHGPGATDEDDYAVDLLLAGQQDMLARDYLTAAATRTFIDYLDVTAAAIVNLNDLSFILVPEISYQLYDNFQLRASALIPAGSTGSELSGTLDSGSDTITVFQPTLILECRLSF